MLKINNIGRTFCKITGNMLCKLWENLARMFPVCWVWPFEVFLKCVIDTLSMDFFLFTTCQQHTNAAHFVWNWCFISDEWWKIFFVSQAETLVIQTLSFILQQLMTQHSRNGYIWTLGVLYFTLFYCVFRERGSTQCCHPALHTFTALQTALL